MDGIRGIKSEKLRERRYRELYARFLEGKRLECDGVKWAMVESERGGGKNPKVCGVTKQ